RTLDRLEALAAAAYRLMPAGELQHFAAGGLDLQHLALARDERAAQALVVIVELDADDALADAGEDIDFVDREVDDVPVGRAKEDARLLAQQDRGHHDLVAVVELDVAPAQLVGCRAERQ